MSHLIDERDLREVKTATGCRPGPVKPPTADGATLYLFLFFAALLSPVLDGFE